MPHPELERLIAVVERLRDPETGCSWDLQQTHQSLLRFLQEEAHEFISACDEENDRKMEDELGDVLLQVLLHATIANQRGAFSLEDVAKTHAEKLIRRHPHIFSDTTTRPNPEQVLDTWEKIKIKEKEGQSHRHYLADKALLKLPAMTAAHKIGERTARIGFDWAHAQDVFGKIREELAELEADIQRQSHDGTKEELGDLLFTLVQLARHLNLDPDEALRASNRKCIGRLQVMQDHIEADGKQMNSLPLAELDRYWDKAKILNRSPSLKMAMPMTESRLFGCPVPIIGLTGGIASGKSHVSRYLETRGFVVISADALVKKIYHENDSIEFIQRHLPSAIQNRQIDFRRLREHAFQNPSFLATLESFLYPRLPAAFSNERSTRPPHSLIIFDVPLLFEKQLASHVDRRVCVYCSRETQLQRLIERDSISMDLAQSIVAQQIPLDVKRTMSDDVIDNSGTRQELESHTDIWIKTHFIYGKAIA